MHILQCFKALLRSSLFSENCHKIVRAPPEQWQHLLSKQKILLKYYRGSKVRETKTASKGNRYIMHSPSILSAQIPHYYIQQRESIVAVILVENCYHRIKVFLNAGPSTR